MTSGDKIVVKILWVGLAIGVGLTYGQLWQLFYWTLVGFGIATILNLPDILACRRAAVPVADAAAPTQQAGGGME